MLDDFMDLLREPHSVPSGKVCCHCDSDLWFLLDEGADFAIRCCRCGRLYPEDRVDYVLNDFARGLVFHPFRSPPRPGEAVVPGVHVHYMGREDPPPCIPAGWTARVIWEYTDTQVGYNASPRAREVWVPDEVAWDDNETWEEVVAEARAQEEMLGLEPGTFGPTYFIAKEGEVSKERYLEWCRENGLAPGL